MDVSPVGGGDITSNDFGYAHAPYAYPENFSTNTTYTLTAVPNTAGGYAFSHWEIQTITIACSGDTISTSNAIQNPLTVSIATQGQYVTARFIEVSAAPALYFPHVSTKSPWQTEIAVINTNTDRNMIGSLRAMSDNGDLLDAKSITLYPRGRRQFNVADWFTDPDRIGYIVFISDVEGAVGYTKFFQEGLFRTAIPAVSEINEADIYIPHIASNDTFWTGISLVNTSIETKTLTITFNDGRRSTVTLNANEHKSLTISSLFNGQQQPGIKSAVIGNAAGIIGLEMFGTDNQLDGILLTDQTDATIYYPHVADTTKWWTGIVAYNPSNSDSRITITPYSASGTALAASSLSIAGKQKYVGVVKNLDLPDQTAWFKITATQPLSGFELFGTLDGSQLAAYAEKSGSGAKEGVFAKIEKSGWTGIAFVNTETGAASVTLSAYHNGGTLLATRTITVGGHAKVVNLVESMFADQDISNATYITYSADKYVVGFQLNGSSDNTMLDGLPSLD
ncbi:MAG: hypothetical protein AB1724_06415 [Thermodesulfobacteriota bacterium]